MTDTVRENLLGFCAFRIWQFLLERKINELCRERIYLPLFSARPERPPLLIAHLSTPQAIGTYVTSHQSDWTHCDHCFDSCVKYKSLYVFFSDTESRLRTSSLSTFCSSAAPQRDVGPNEFTPQTDHLPFGKWEWNLCPSKVSTSASSLSSFFGCRLFRQFKLNLRWPSAVL